MRGGQFVVGRCISIVVRAEIRGWQLYMTVVEDSAEVLEKAQWVGKTTRADELGGLLIRSRVGNPAPTTSSFDNLRGLVITGKYPPHGEAHTARAESVPAICCRA